MVVENAVSGTTPESPISVQLDWDLVTETAMAYGLHNSSNAHQTMLIKPFSEHSCPVDGGIAMVAKIMACPAFLYMTLSMMRC
jgi:hypothetical protein